MIRLTLASKLTAVSPFCSESSDPLPSLSQTANAWPNKEEDVKVKVEEEEEAAPLTQLAHSSTLEQEVCCREPSSPAVDLSLSF